MIKMTPILIIYVLIAVSCSNNITRGKFTAIEPWKEWEIELKFYKDSTFTIIDSFGCNRFYYSGQWRYHNDSILAFIVLHDTTRSEYDKSHDVYQYYDIKTQKQQIVRAKEYFSVISEDTVWVLNKRQISFRQLTFYRKRLFSSNDLEKERAKMIEDFYISKIGKELYIKTLGDGKGIKEARKNIIDCKVTPIPNIELGRNN
jgi:hypothetical protein